LNLIHTPLAVITKAAAIVSDDVFIDMMPVAWELLIEADEELAAAAGNSSLSLCIVTTLFILCFRHIEMCLYVCVKCNVTGCLSGLPFH